MKSLATVIKIDGLELSKPKFDCTWASGRFGQTRFDHRRV